MSLIYWLGAARINDEIQTTAYTPTISDRSVMSYFHYMWPIVLMVVLKCKIFYIEIVWISLFFLWKTTRLAVF